MRLPCMPAAYRRAHCPAVARPDPSTKQAGRHTAQRVRGSVPQPSMCRGQLLPGASRSSLPPALRLRTLGLSPTVGSTPPHSPPALQQPCLPKVKGGIRYLGAADGGVEIRVRHPLGPRAAQPAGGGAVVGRHQQRAQGAGGEGEVGQRGGEVLGLQGAGGRRAGVYHSR